MNLKELGEFGLIQKIAGGISFSDRELIRDIGDDAAVTQPDIDRYLLSTVDTLIEDVHFSLTYTSPSLLGRKAVTASLSDIAAMGGTPKYILVSISIPDNIESEFIGLLYQGIKEQAGPYGVRIIGGDTTFSPDRLVISIFMLGDVPKGQVIFRDGAQEGDRIYVTGTLGDSALGLKILKEGALGIDDSPYREVIMAHIDPQPRVEVGRVLAEREIATSMIDISDGLLKDLKHITEESRVGARIEFSRLPTSATLKKYLLKAPEDITLPLTGGEDYELLFTSPPSLFCKVEETAKELSCPLSYIGDIVSLSKGVTVIDKDEMPVFSKYEGFDHFLKKVQQFTVPGSRFNLFNQERL